MVPIQHVRSHFFQLQFAARQERVTLFLGAMVAGPAVHTIAVRVIIIEFLTMLFDSLTFETPSC